jgi:predicted GNAT family N-acyltransferase
MTLGEGILRRGFILCLRLSKPEKNTQGVGVTPLILGLNLLELQFSEPLSGRVMTKPAGKGKKSSTEIIDQALLDEREAPSVTVLVNNFTLVEDHALKRKRLLVAEAEVSARTRISKLGFQAWTR